MRQINSVTGKRMKRHYYVENADTLDKVSDIFTVRRDVEREWKRLNKHSGYIFVIVTEYM
jgi:hypothetical protein